LLIAVPKKPLPAAKFSKPDISSESARAFPGGVGDIFAAELPQKRSALVHKKILAFCQLVSLVASNHVL